MMGVSDAACRLYRPEAAAKLKWRESDIMGASPHCTDWCPTAPRRACRVCQPGISAPRSLAGRMAGPSYGERGTLVGEGLFALAICWQAGTELEPLGICKRLLDALPHVGDNVQSKWGALGRDFVADIQGKTHDPYLTFRDGWRYQAAIDAIREGAGGAQMPG